MRSPYMYKNAIVEEYYAYCVVVAWYFPIHVSVMFIYNSIYNWLTGSCGTSLVGSTHTKIVGGTTASHGEFPWQVSNKYILTL